MNRGALGSRLLVSVAFAMIGFGAQACSRTSDDKQTTTIDASTDTPDAQCAPQAITNTKGCLYETRLSCGLPSDVIVSGPIVDAASARQNGARTLFSDCYFDINACQSLCAPSSSGDVFDCRLEECDGGVVTPKPGAPVTVLCANCSVGAG